MVQCVMWTRPLLAYITGHSCMCKSIPKRRESLLLPPDYILSRDLFVLPCVHCPVKRRCYCLGVHRNLLTLAGSHPFLCVWQILAFEHLKSDPLAFSLCS